MSSNYPLNSQGSSTAAAPLDSEPGDCLFDFELGWVNKLGTSYTRMRGQSELFNQNQEVFQGRWRVNFIPVNGFESTVQKNYPKLECKAPGSYERFYKIFHGIAHWYPGSCEQHAYQATFVPTTSAFDIQDVIPVDYSYPVSQKLFYRTPGNQDVDDLFGYPHNNLAFSNPKAITPFDAVFAHKESGFHMQNPRSEIATFVLDEVAPDELYLQNRTIKGHSSEIYHAKFDARNFIETGKDVTDITIYENFVLDEYTDVEFVAPEIELKNGFTAKAGSTFVAKVGNDKPEPCFTFINPNNKWNENEHREQTDSIKSAGAEEVSDYMLYPNPTTGQLEISSQGNNAMQSIHLMNLQGQILEKIFPEEGSTSVSINVSTYTSGMYFLIVRDSSSKHILKVLKQ